MSGEASLEGKVKWFNDAKGYGFIENPSGDVFVHYSVIEADGFKTLKDGETVIYELNNGGKGLHALWVRRAIQQVAEEANRAAAGARPSLAQEVSVELMEGESATASEIPAAEIGIQNNEAESAAKS